MVSWVRRNAVVSRPTRGMDEFYARPFFQIAMLVNESRSLKAKTFVCTLTWEIKDECQPNFSKTYEKVHKFQAW